MNMDESENTESTLKVRELTLSGYVGFDTLPLQLVKKRTQAGYVFNILLIGETGIGKSTLISSLFNYPMNSTQEPHSNSEVKLKVKKYYVTEKGVNLHLTVIETVGYCDQISREDNINPVIKYIDTQFEKYLKEEMKIERDLSHHHDTRVHVCLYFICPTGHSLKGIDLFAMRHLQNKVNIIPIVAKSDSLSKADLQSFKTAVRKELDDQKIKIYQFPTDDEDTAELNSSANANIPFAVAASADYIQIGNKSVRARVFPWGTMLVEDEEHSEFLLLKDMLITTNMEDLREKTDEEHYELYRSNRIDQMGYSELTTFQEMHQRREDILREMQEREEKLNEKFVEKVKKENLDLKEQERQMRLKYEDSFAKLMMEEKLLLDEKKGLELKISEFQKLKNSNGMRSPNISLEENTIEKEMEIV